MLTTKQTQQGRKPWNKWGQRKQCQMGLKHAAMQAEQVRNMIGQRRPDITELDACKRRHSVVVHRNSWALHQREERPDKQQAVLNAFMRGARRRRPQRTADLSEWALHLSCWRIYQLHQKCHEAFHWLNKACYLSFSTTYFSTGSRWRIISYYT